MDDLFQALLKTYECPICFQLIDKPVSTRCGHTFCQGCIEKHLKATPNCPICRSPNTGGNISDIKVIKETVHQLVRLNALTQTSQAMVQNAQNAARFQQNQEAKEETWNHIVLQTNSLVIPYVYQRADLSRDQFRNLNREQLAQLFQNGGEYLLLNPQSNLNNETIGYKVKIQQVTISNNRMQAQFLCEERMEVVEQRQESFRTGEAEYQLPVAVCKLCKDEFVDLQDASTKRQIEILLGNIREFLQPFLMQGQNDTTQQVILSKFQQTGILGYMEMNIEEDYTMLNRFSFTILGLLRLPAKEKASIIHSVNVIERLILINNSLNRFQGAMNPLAIFEIDEKQTKSDLQSIVLYFGILIVFLIYQYFY